MNFAAARDRMIAMQLLERGIHDPRVLLAMTRTPRELFVPEEYRTSAYDDTPLPIGDGQTISQPYIVALMSEALRLKGHETVLEVGAGSGYQSAILAALAQQVWAIEQYAALAARAQEALDQLQIKNVELRVGDGSAGWPEPGPYDAILVAATAPKMPDPLLAQLKPDGRIIIPIGPPDGQQELECWRRRGDAWHIERLTPVRFVPMLGRWGWSDRSGSPA